MTCRCTATSTRGSVEQQIPARRLVCPLALLLGAQQRHQLRPIGPQGCMCEPGPVVVLTVVVHCVPLSVVSSVRLSLVVHAKLQPLRNPLLLVCSGRC